MRMFADSLDSLHMNASTTTECMLGSLVIEVYRMPHVFHCKVRRGTLSTVKGWDYTDWDGVNRRTDELTVDVYQVYNWRLTRIIDYLCFVEIFYLKGKGQAVHVSQIATRRLANPKDVVKRA